MTMNDLLPSAAGTQAGWVLAVCRQATSDIAAADWDLMFRATLDVLSHVAVEQEAQGASGRRLQTPGSTLCECMEALDHLRRSVPARGLAEADGRDPVDGATAAAQGAVARVSGP